MFLGETIILRKYLISLFCSKFFVFAPTKTNNSEKQL